MQDFLTKYLTIHHFLGQANNNGKSECNSHSLSQINLKCWALNQEIFTQACWYTYYLKVMPRLGYKLESYSSNSAQLCLETWQELITPYSFISSDILNPNTRHCPKQPYRDWPLLKLYCILSLLYFSAVQIWVIAGNSRNQQILEWVIVNFWLFWINHCWESCKVWLYQEWWDIFSEIARSLYFSSSPCTDKLQLILSVEGEWVNLNLNWTILMGSWWRRRILWNVPVCEPLYDPLYRGLLRLLMKLLS